MMIESQLQTRSGQLVRERRPEKARRCSSYCWKESKVAAVDRLPDIPPISFTQLRIGPSHIRIFLNIFLFVSLPARRLGFGNILYQVAAALSTVAFCGMGWGWFCYVGLQKQICAL